MTIPGGVLGTLRALTFALFIVLLVAIGVIWIIPVTTAAAAAAARRNLGFAGLTRGVLVTFLAPLILFFGAFGGLRPSPPPPPPPPLLDAAPVATLVGLVTVEVRAAWAFFHDDGCDQSSSQE